MIKLDGAADYPEAVTALTRAGIPIFAQFGLTPQTALQYGIPYSAQSAADAVVPDGMLDKMVAEAKVLEAAGAALLDFTNSGPGVGPAVVAAVEIPVIGGFGGGPWLDGRVRLAHAAIGYAASFLEREGTYANVAKTTFDALKAVAADVRSARQIKY
jgi:3-methyl-2-oxobutanoate hydroxymethyltransferase